MRVHLHIASLALVLFGCSSSSSSSSSGTSTAEYDPLFTTAQAPSTDATKTIGLWETTQQTTQDGVTINELSRIDIRASAIKWAIRCSADGYPTVTTGLTVNATVDAMSITVNDKGGTASQTVDGPAGKPPMLCGVQLQGPGKMAYVLGNGKLQLGNASFTKITD